MWAARSIRWSIAGAVASLAAMAVNVVPARAATPAPVAAAAASAFHPVVPSRVMDTRSGIGTAAAPLHGGETRALQVAGRAGIPAGAVAVALNVTVTQPTTSSFVTVWPAGQPMPTASNLDVVGGQTVANMVTSGLGPGGQISLFNFAGDAQIVVDVSGWYSGGFHPVVPTRVVDTRSGTGGGFFRQGESRDIDLSAAGVPGGATAVVANVTVTNVTGASYLTVWPSGAQRPTASNLNMVPGQTVANMVTIGLGANRRISAYNYAGNADLIVDVAGWYTSGFHPVVPARIMDTRSALCGVRLGPGETRQVAIAGQGGVPAGAGAVALNVTIVNPTASTFLTVWPSGSPQPTASNLDAIVGTVPNMVTVGVGAGGRVSLYNYAGSADVLIDVTGYFDGGGAGGAGGCVSSGAPAPVVNADPALPPKWALSAVTSNTPPQVVSALQERLFALGFWVPDYDGSYGPVTTQAVLAFQKYLGLPLTGHVDDYTALLLNMDGLRAAGQSTSGDRVEIDLTKQLLFIVRGGKTIYTVNTSTGSGNFYSEPNQTSGGTVSGVAITPVGHFHVYREDGSGWEHGELGDLYRPKFFSGDVAVHGAPRVPSVPASHGCVRVTPTFMDFVWGANLMPMGSEVWTHH
jgi:hypothetical protein